MKYDPDIGDVTEQVGAFDLIDDGYRYRAGQRTTAKGGAVHAG